jgi:peptidoglycan-associated lipoprotein
MSFMTTLGRSPLVLITVAVLALAGCSKKQTLPDNANQLGLGGAPAGSTQEFTTQIGDRVFFETDSSTLTATAQATLSKQAQWLQQYTNYSIQVEGHADERGTREYNLALGARRSTAVRNYLVAQGVPASKISTISYGKERPVAVCNDISCWSQNRRGVTVLR